VIYGLSDELVELKEKLIKQFLESGLSKEDAYRQAMLAIKRSEIGSNKRKLVFIHRGEWLETASGNRLPIVVYDLITARLCTIWESAENGVWNTLKPLDMFEILVGSNEDRIFLREVSASSIKKVGKFDPKEFRNSPDYKTLSEIASIREDLNHIITEGDVLYNPKETSVGSLRITITDIYNDPGEIFTVFVNPDNLYEEIMERDRILIIGNVRYNEDRLANAYTINARLVTKIEPPSLEEAGIEL